MEFLSAFLILLTINTRSPLSSKNFISDSFSTLLGICFSCLSVTICTDYLVDLLRSRGCGFSDPGLVGPLLCLWYQDVHSLLCLPASRVADINLMPVWLWFLPSRFSGLSLKGSRICHCGIKIILSRPHLSSWNLLSVKSRDLPAKLQCHKFPPWE